VTEEVLVSASSADGSVKLWSVPGLEPIRTLPVDALYGFRVLPADDGRPGIVTWEQSGPIKWWPVEGGDPVLLGSIPYKQEQFSIYTFWDFDQIGRSLLYGHGNQILKSSLGGMQLGESEVVGNAHDLTYGVKVSPDGQFVAVSFREGKPGLRMWSLKPAYREVPVGTFSQGTTGHMDFSPDSTWLAVGGIGTNFYLIDLEGPPEAEPLVLHRRGTVLPRSVAFSPDGSWLVTVESSTTDLWPIRRRYASVLRKDGQVWGVAMAPDGSWVAASGPSGDAWIWPAKRSAALESRSLVDGKVPMTLRLAVSADGSTIGMGSADGRVWAIAPDGGSTRVVRPFSASPTTVGFGSQDLVFASAAGRQTDDAFIRLWDLEVDETRDLRPDHGSWITRVWFTPDDKQLIESSLDSLAIWDLETGERRELLEGPVWDGQLGPDGRSVVFLEETGHFQGTPRRIDIDSGEDLSIADFGVISGLNVTKDGLLVGCTPEGTILVGDLAEGKPHLLFSHSGTAISVEVQGDRIVSGGSEDGTVRIWTMPDMDETPFHLLPYEELLAKLRALTNVRVVPDENSETGYGTEVTEFPGWEVVPTW
jgi:WD40 repeat protein